MRHQGTLATAIVVVLMSGVVSAAAMTGTFSHPTAAPAAGAVNSEVTSGAANGGHSPAKLSPGQGSNHRGGVTVTAPGLGVGAAPSGVTVSAGSEAGSGASAPSTASGPSGSASVNVSTGSASSGSGSSAPSGAGSVPTFS